MHTHTHCRNTHSHKRHGKHSEVQQKHSVTNIYYGLSTDLENTLTCTHTHTHTHTHTCWSVLMTFWELPAARKTFKQMKNMMEICFTWYLMKITVFVMLCTDLTCSSAAIFCLVFVRLSQVFYPCGFQRVVPDYWRIFILSYFDWQQRLVGLHKKLLFILWPVQEFKSVKKHCVSGQSGGVTSITRWKSENWGKIWTDYSF